MSTKHWSDLQILVFERREFRLKIRYLAHWDSIRDNKYYSNLLQLPTVLFGAISSTAAFTSLEENNNVSSYIICGLTTIMTLLASINQFYKFSELSEKHRDSALAYESILNELCSIRRKGPQEGNEFSDIILEFDNKYLGIKTNAPMLSEALIMKHSSAEKDLFNSVNNVQENSNSDIESAVSDQRSEIEIKALHTETYAEELVKKLQVLNNQKSSKGSSFLILKNLFSTFQTCALRKCVQNWRVGNNSYKQSNLMNQLELERCNSKRDKESYEKEMVVFRHELNRAANEGVMREAKETKNMSTSESEMNKMEAEMKKMKSEVENVTTLNKNLGSKNDQLQSQLTEKNDIISNLEKNSQN